MKRIIVPILVAVMVVGMIFAGCAQPTTPTTPPEEAGKIRFGHVMPLSGPAAQWGLPQARVLDIWAEIVNEEGGLEVAGKKYMLEIVHYDDKGFIPAEALKGVKKGVLEEGLLIWESTPTDSVVEALGPYLEEVGGMLVTHGPNIGIRPEWPHVFSGCTLWPAYQLGGILYLHELYPEVKTAAVLYPDFPYVSTERPWINVGLRVCGIEKVYEQIYPTDTTDYAPILSAALATNPDMISLDSTPMAFVPDIMATARGMGYTGKWFNNTLNVGPILEKVPADYLEGAIAGSTNLDDPEIIPPMLYNIYLKYIERWEEDCPTDNFGGFLALATVAKAMQLSGTTTDVATIVNTMRTTNPYPTLYVGEAVWAGEELWGINNDIMHATYVGSVVNSRSSVGMVFDWAKFYRENLDVFLEELEAERARGT